MTKKSIQEKRDKKRGFTLVEILIVISIIGFLASAAVYALNNARTNSRDAKRKSDLATLAKALEMYYDDYKHYPVSAVCGSESPRSNFPDEADVAKLNVYNQEGLMDNTFVLKILKNKNYITANIFDPIDPDGSKLLYKYYTNSDGQHFILKADLEKPTDDDAETLNSSVVALPSGCAIAGDYQISR